MDARVILTDETKEKIKKPISNRHKGELRLQKLKEISKTGEICKARTKVELAKMCGYSEEEKQNGYAWVGYLIKRGLLRETIVSKNEYGVAEYEYAFIGNKKTKKIEPKKVELVETKQETSENVIMTIRKGDAEIKVENGGQELAVEIIKLIVKG